MNKKQHEFYKIVMDYYKKDSRDNLPWRKNTSPYYVTASEIMLQQTQVDRVIPFFKNWIQLFPNWKQLAHAEQKNVLKAWKGLGYNSRALRLQKLAQIVSTEHNGKLPQTKKELESLPGIGPYTAGAILAFSFNVHEEPIIETNIRRVIIHHFFKNKENISDEQILKILKKIEIENPCEWYWALMDYGSYLKSILPKNPNKKSKHYTVQKKFEGSDRQIRGKILELLLEKHTRTKKYLWTELKIDESHLEKIIRQLQKEGFLEIKKEKVILK